MTIDNTAWLQRNVIFILLAIRKLKSLENSQDFFVKTKTKTLLFVLEAPRDQDFGLEDYITGGTPYGLEIQRLSVTWQWNIYCVWWHVESHMAGDAL